MHIEEAINGYIVSYYSPEQNASVKQVVTKKDTDNPTRDEQEALREVFYILRDYFNVGNDKHWNNGEGQYMDITLSSD